MTIYDLEGQLLEDRYLLTRRMGKGNFGAVYRAKEQFMDGTPIRTVALKIFKPEATRDGNYEEILRDCALPETILQSDIPETVKRHFVKLYSWGTLLTPLGACAYISMELLRNGVTLEQIMNRNADKDYVPDAAIVLNYMRQFYAGLKASHDAGVLHRDIKGANVMVENETVKILDFGMGVRSSNPNAQLMTTLSIHAPENFDNHHSIESDIFQAGLMFYQFWTNVHPFESSIRNKEAAFFDPDLGRARLQSAQMGWKYRSGTEYADFEDNAQDCDMLDAILRKSLQYDYNARFRSVQEILDILNAEEGEAPLFEKIHTSLEKKNYAECIHNCQAYTKLKDAPKKRLCTALETIGDCHMEEGGFAKAIPAYIKAFTFAKKEGIYFNDPGAFNQLVEKTAMAYKRQGNPEMADMFLKNRRK